MWRELIVAVHDFLVNSKWIIIIKWRVPCEHLENEYSKCPPIHKLIVSLGLNNFRSQIFRCAAESIGPIIHDFSEAKICYFYMSLFVNQ